MTIDSFTPPAPLNTAVLFLVFNRLDTTKQVFEAIKQAKPPRLYIAADGARTSKEGEAEKVSIVRDFILQNIDWDCEVKTLFREENLGCKYAVSGAIDWFFEQEEMGIILEDDCLPSQSFFWFCEELLKRYKGDKRIGHISGYNHFPNRIKESDYFYSTMPGIWGWATWRDRWESYDVNIKTFSQSHSCINDRFRDKYLCKYWINIFNNINALDTWDYQWTYNLIVNNYNAIRPSLNLVRNIGFGMEATHTQKQNLEISNNLEMEIDVRELKSPIFKVPSLIEDQLFFRKRLKIKWCKRVYRKVKYAIFQR